MEDFELFLPCCGFAKEYESIFRLEDSFKCEICREKIELERIIEFKRNKYIILQNQAIKQLIELENYKNQSIIEFGEYKVNEIYMKVSMTPITKYYHYKQSMDNLSYLLERIKKLAQYFEKKEKYKIDGKSYERYLKNNKIIRGKDNYKCKYKCLHSSYDPICCKSENSICGLMNSKINTSIENGFEIFLYKLFRKRKLIILKNGNLVECLSNNVNIQISESCFKTINIPNIRIITCIVELENGNFAIGSGDARIEILDIKSSKCVKTLFHDQTFKLIGWYDRRLKAFNDFILAVLLNGNLVSAYEDGKIKIWDKTSFECVKTLDGKNSPITSMVVLENGNLATGYENGKILIWDIKSFLCVKMLTDSNNDSFFYNLFSLSDVLTLAVLVNGNLVSGHYYGKLKIWDKTSFECIETLSAHNKGIHHIDVLENGSLAILSGYEVLIWVNNNITYPFQ